MKKNLVRILAGVMALVMVLSLAACGGKPEGGKNADGKYVSIQAFLEDPEVKPEIDAIIETLLSSDSGMSAAAKGKSWCIHLLSLRRFCPRAPTWRQSKPPWRRIWAQ